MSKRRRRACVALALGLAVMTGPAAAADPPDPARECTLATLDTITPCVLFASRLFQEQCPYLQQPSQARPAFGTADVLANLDKLTKARDLYRLAEYYRRLGHFAAAATYYEEAHLVCPTCRYGLRAMERLSQIGAGRAEEQETADAAGFDWGDMVHLLGGCADVSFAGATRFQMEIPVGIVRVRVEYNAQRDGDLLVGIRVP
jgi:hypothetical protein